MKSQNQMSLAARLRELIGRAGAISFHDWMAAALYDEREGFYCRTDLQRWGRAGDYRTSPERSSLFAATFARYFASLYVESGAPPEWTILEVGAGAGDFARGTLETLQRDYPHVYKATRYLLDEVSDDARARARKSLAAFGERLDFRSIGEEGFRCETGIVFSNELLDAFPVYRVRMRGGKLQEMCVGLNEAGHFIWTEREPTTPRLAEHFSRLRIPLAEGHFAEINLAAGEWLEKVAAVLACGYIITVDYGAEAAELYQSPLRREGTLRGFRAHQFAADVLAQPGQQDLTTTVNWTQMKLAGEAANLENVSFERQDEFLLRAGLLEQLTSATTRMSNEAERMRLRVEAREMILPGGMSQSFQVLVQKKSR
ncbi:MAG: class I SAM-dependent methyltransferase [Pyrinomonadaceae bacterium]